MIALMLLVSLLVLFTLICFICRVQKSIAEKDYKSGNDDRKIDNSNTSKTTEKKLIAMDSESIGRLIHGLNNGKERNIPGAVSVANIELDGNNIQSAAKYKVVQVPEINDGVAFDADKSRINMQSFDTPGNLMDVQITDVDVDDFYLKDSGDKDNDATTNGESIVECLRNVSILSIDGVSEGH